MFFLKAFLNMLVFSRKRDLFLFPHNHKTILVSGGGGSRTGEKYHQEIQRTDKTTQKQKVSKILDKKKKTSDTPEQLQRH